MFFEAYVMRFLIWILLLTALPLGAAVDMRRGSVAVLAGDPGLSLVVAGEAGPDLSDRMAALPIYVEGVFHVETAEPANLFFRGLNAVDFAFRGPGYLGIERFDQSFFKSGDAASPVPESTRTILNLRRGELVVDARTAIGSTQIGLEAPFGRISAADGALWSIDIAYDRRSERYDFTLAVAEGSLQLKDQQGQTFQLYAGQRLSGAGSFLDPAVEIGEPSDRSQAGFEDYLARKDRLSTVSVDPRAFFQATVDLPDATTRADTATPRSDKRPLLIELAPKARPLTPYRGEILPANPDGAELF